MKSPEQSKSTEKKKISSWKKVAASLALAGALTACDNVPTDKVILDPKDKSAKFSVEYVFSGWWGGDPTIIDYDITVRKEWDIYQWFIKEKDGFLSDKTNIESQNIDEVFNWIENRLDNERVTDNTISKKNAKIKFVKDAYKKNILKNQNPESDKKIKIKYDTKSE